MKSTQRARDVVEELSSADLNNLAKWARGIGYAYGFTLEEAQDLVNEAIKRLIERNPYLDSKEGLRRYLMTSIRNVGLDLLRIKQVERRMGYVKVDDETIEAVPAEEQKAEPGDLEKILKQMSTRESEVARLTLEGYNSIEIAKILGIESATVRSLLRRIRTRFAA